MSLSSLQDAKEQIRQAIDIVDLIGGYIALRRQGRSFVGLCPWHDDAKPSFTVNPDRQSFKCWPCDVGGDIFTFVMRAEGMEFREALEMLADRAGVSLAPANRLENQADNPFERRNLLKAMAWAEEQFHQCLLRSPGAEPARRYLADRGVNEESIAAFHIGFSPNEWDWMLKRGATANWQPAVLERVGLIGKREAGGYYDRFRGRLMFSIRDSRARTIAFGGRVLPEFKRDNDAKYVNSPETPLFNKSSELYALDLARDAIAKEGGVLVMEGYTDVIMAHQHGVKHAVAVLGTALGEKHVPLIRRFTDKITLVLDGDAAGQNRTLDILDNLLALFVAHEVELKILSLPEGADPCDVIRSHGSDEFRRLLTQSVDALEHKINAVTKGLAPGAAPHQSAQAVEAILATLAKMLPTGASASSTAFVREQQMLVQIARRFGLAEETLRTRLKAVRQAAASLVRSTPLGRNAEQSTPVAPKPVPQKLSAWDRELLEIVLCGGDLMDALLEQIHEEDVEHPIARQIYAMAAEMYHDGVTPTFASLMNATEDSAVKNLLVGCDEVGQLKLNADVQKRFSDLLADRERRHTEARHRMTVAELKTNQLDSEQADRALVALFNDLKRRQAGSTPTDG
ncbi:DNA primase [Lacipirellula parvula]|uniref:DNA primase n=1 Tax=Lacipirellula parvula TaxID=2650471 RepID=A0A5K7X6P8_9BACT|nr:DNA primase [Lacipirellula parvula]BBO32404.1 DNA primase [Lacipirellula parvula]